MPDGFRKIILCGVLLTVEAGHFKRKTPWKDALKYRGPWEQQFGDLQAFVRSMSGWTQEKFGEPDRQWLEARQ